MAELGTRSTIERVDDGNSPPDVARAWALFGKIYESKKRLSH